MSYHTAAGGHSDHREPRYYNEDYERPRTTRYRDDHYPAQTPVTLRARRRWPPPPSVEDEVVSLSREHSPVLPQLDDSDVRERGSVDQMPILFEISKGQEDEPKRRKSGKRGQRISSSDESNGPDTPTDSSASESNDSKNRHQRSNYGIPVTGPTIKDVLEGKRRPEAVRRTFSNKTAEKLGPRLNTPADTFHRSTSSRELHGMAEIPHLYPGTLEELKTHPKEREPLGFAHRQRTMSGSYNAPDRRPANIRHMSTMGYAGESQTPSFPRDHQMYTSPTSTTSRNMPPEWRRPREHLQTAIDSGSESDVSPDEVRKQRYKQRTLSRSDQSNRAQELPTRPPKEPLKRYSRPSSPERGSDGYKHGPGGSHRKTYDKPSSPVAHRKPNHSSSNSPYPSPPASPRAGSRPSSRDGPQKVVYPIINKKSQQPQRISRPGSPVTTNQHNSSNLRYSSRPNSPTLHPPNEHREKKHTEDPQKRRDALRPEQLSSREPSPNLSSRSRSPNPGLRVDVAAHAPLKPGPEMQQRPSTSDGQQAYNVSPTVPMSPSDWNNKEARTQPVPPPSTVKHSKVQNGPISLIACPRPGFSAKYHDWWTLSRVHEVDICPDCKESLEENGFSGKFVKREARPAGTQTRCDLNISWVRIACLLILAGREDVDVLKELMGVLGSEEECPAHHGGVRKKWYRPYDEDSDKTVADFSVCPCCVRSIRVLFPNLKGTFNSHVSTSGFPRMCDLTASTPRFARYIDLLDQISAEAEQHKIPPNTKHFIRMTRDFAGVVPCRRDDQFRGVHWHYISHIPDFTICHECFVEVVKPAQRAGWDVADRVSRKAILPADPHLKLSCQLYSHRMRLIFNECCEKRDLGALREHTMARVNKERELQNRAEIIRGMPDEWQEQEMKRLIDEWRRWE